MKKLLIAFLAVSLAGQVARAQVEETATPPATEPLEETMSLVQALDYALQNSKVLQQVALQKDIDNAKVGEIRANGLPQVNASANITDNYQIPTSFLPGEFVGMPGTLTPVQFGAQFTGSAGIGVNQMVFDGSYFVGLQAANTFRELSTKEYLKTEADVVEQVTKAYYLALITHEQSKLLARNAARFDSLYRDTRLLVKNGFAEKIDADRIKVSLNNLKTEQNALERSLATVYNLLKFQMGMPLETTLTLSDKLESIEFDPEVALEKDFSYMQRIEYSQLATQRQLAYLDMRNNQVGYIPSLYAFFNYGFNTGTNDFDEFFDFNDRWFSNGSFGVNLNIPVFDGLRKSYKIQQAKLQMEQLELQAGLLEQNIDLEIQQARLELSSAVARMESQKENMELAEEVYRVSNVRYKEGVGARLDVIDADTALKEARTNYFQSLYDAVLAKVALQKALGALN